MARSPSVSPRRAASTVAMRSAPSASRFRQAGSRQDGVGGERSPLPGGEQERPVRVVAGGIAEIRQLGQQVGDRDVDHPVGGRDAPPGRVELVVGEHDARRAVHDGVEQAVPGVGTASEARPLDPVRIEQCAALGDRPKGGGAGRTVRQRGTERAVEHDRGDGAEDGVGRDRGGERGGELGATALGCVAQWLQVVVVDDPGGFDESGVDLGLGERTVRRLDHGTAEMEDIARELEVEERGLVLLELRRGRQHVVGHPGGLGHEDVDDDDGVEGSDRLAHALAVGDRMDGVPRLDDQRTEPVRMVGEDLLGQDVARHQAGNDA